MHFVLSRNFPSLVSLARLEHFSLLVLMRKIPNDGRTQSGNVRKVATSSYMNTRKLVKPSTGQHQAECATILLCSQQYSGLNVVTRTLNSLEKNDMSCPRSSHSCVLSLSLSAVHKEFDFMRLNFMLAGCPVCIAILMIQTALEGFSHTV